MTENKEAKTITLGERIINIRLSLGETMEEFGRRFNAHKSVIQKWESNKTTPNPKRLLLISELENSSFKKLKSEMYIVASHEDGLVMTTDNFDEAVKEYNSQCDHYTSDVEYIDLGDMVVLGKIIKMTSSVETDEVVTEDDVDGHYITNEQVGNKFWAYKEWQSDEVNVYSDAVVKLAEAHLNVSQTIGFYEHFGDCDNEHSHWLRDLEENFVIHYYF